VSESTAAAMIPRHLPPEACSSGCRGDLVFSSGNMWCHLAPWSEASGVLRADQPAGTTIARGVVRRKSVMVRRGHLIGAAVLAAGTLCGCQTVGVQLDSGADRDRESRPALALFSWELAALQGRGQHPSDLQAWPQNRRDGHMVGDGDRSGPSESLVWTTYRDRQWTVNGQPRSDFRSTTSSFVARPPRGLWRQ
jgi:hypothetical protein